MAAFRDMTEQDGTADGLANMAEALSQVDDRRAAFDILTSFVRAQGFLDLVLTIETNGTRVKCGEARWSTLDEKHLAALEEIGFDGHDPVRRLARRAIDPCIWAVSDWPDLNSDARRKAMAGLRNASIHAGMTTTAWGRAGRIAVLDAFGIPERMSALSPAVKEAFHLAAAMTFRAFERLSLVRGGTELTTREIEILDLVSRGLTTRSIADRLQIVDPTVKFHLKNIRAKFNARSTSEAVAQFADLDLSTGLTGYRQVSEVRSDASKEYCTVNSS